MIAIYTTLPSYSAAQALAKSLLQAKLIACAQINEINSLYEWDGEVRHDIEQRLILKTDESLYGQVEAHILASHPYDLPAIYAVPVVKSHSPYQNWVATQTQARPPIMT